MKRTFVIAAALASGLALSAFAQSKAAPAAAPTSKVAVIAFQTAVAQTNEFQRSFDAIKTKYTPKRNHLKSEDDEIQSLTKQLEAQKATLSASQRAARTADIDARKKQFERDATDAQSDYQQDVQDAFKAVAAKVYPVLTAYAKQHGYTLVLDGSNQQSPILYAVESADITKPVLDAYNQESGVAAPSAGAPAPAARHSARPGAHPAR